MKTLFTLISLFLLLGNTVVAQQTNAEFPKLTGPYLGQKPPGMIPELFAPGIVSTGAYEHGSPVFTKDLNEIYWTVNIDRDGRFITRLNYMMKCIDGVWSKPAIPEVFKEFAFCDYPFITPDGKRMFFSGSKRMKPAVNEPEKNDIYTAEKRVDGWSKPECLNLQINLPDCEFFGPTVSQKGTLYCFASNKAHSDSSGLCYADCNNGIYSPIKRMDRKFYQSGSDYTPYIAPDESYFIFSSRRTGSFGMGDLYVCFKQSDGEWGEAINMGDKINTERNERFPNVTPDGKYLFFNSSRKIEGADAESAGNGTGDVYWVDASFIEDLRNEVFKDDK